jgi:lipoyl(octanoyl) transferase
MDQNHPALFHTQHPHRVGSLEVYSLGVVDFPAAVVIQEHMVFELGGRKDDQSVLLLCEYPPTITWGRDGHADQVQLSKEEFAKRKIHTAWVSRGGTCIPHVPGQLAVHLLCPLAKIPLDLPHRAEKSPFYPGLSPVEFIDLLAGSAVRCCEHFKIPVQYIPEAGALIAAGGQIGYLGARVRFGVSSFGMYLNVAPWLDFFRNIEHPVTQNRVTSLAREKVQHVDSSKVREFLINDLASTLRYDRVHIYTRHPMLERQFRKLPANVLH